jgi:hypothetical protein
VGREFRAVWSISELAEASGLSRFQVRRLLKSNGVLTERIGRKVIVSFTSLKAVLPGLYATLASHIEE